MTTRETPRNRWPFFVVTGLVLLLVGAASAWAVVTVLQPAEDPLEATDHTFVEVVPGEVGASLNLNTIAEWKPVPVGENRAVGVVTGVSVKAGDEVSQGTVLYSVNLRPVVIGQGDVPAFRPIAKGIEGPDVGQLQRMLTALGHYHLGIDGKAQDGTVAAIKRWQASLGVEKTGIVEAGDVIFVPQLPIRVALDHTIVARGKTLAGGEAVLRGLPASPVFSIPVTDAQANMVPSGTRVEITSPEDATWIAMTTDVERGAEDGSVTIALSGANGAAVCTEQCGQVPATGQVSLRSKIVTVETVAGLVVPSSALLTTADGATVVIDAAGKRIRVQVQSSAKGMSVVTGVDEGLKVRVPAKDKAGE